MATVHARSIPSAVGAMLLAVLTVGHARDAASTALYPASSVFALESGQTARLYVVNTVPPEPVKPRDPCRADVKFVDAAGATVLGATLMVGPLETKMHDLAHTGARTRVRAVIELDRRTCRRRSILVSAEVFDTASGTPLFLPPSPCGASCGASTSCLRYAARAHAKSSNLVATTRHFSVRGYVNSAGCDQANPENHP